MVPLFGIVWATHAVVAEGVDDVAGTSPVPAPLPPPPLLLLLLGNQKVVLVA